MPDCQTQAYSDKCYHFGKLQKSKMAKKAVYPRRVQVLLETGIKTSEADRLARSKIHNSI